MLQIKEIKYEQVIKSLADGNSKVKDRVIKMVGSDQPYVNDVNMFTKGDALYEFFLNRYRGRILRHEEDTFLGYFIEKMIENLPNLYKNQVLYHNNQWKKFDADNLSQNTRLIRDTVLGTTPNADTGDEWQETTKSDSISRDKEKSVNDNLLELQRRLLTIDVSYGVAEFLDEFNSLFREYLGSGYDYRIGIDQNNGVQFKCSMLDPQKCRSYIYRMFYKDDNKRILDGNNPFKISGYEAGDLRTGIFNGDYRSLYYFTDLYSDNDKKGYDFSDYRVPNKKQIEDYVKSKGGGISKDEIKKMIDDAINKIPRGITEARAKELIKEAIDNLPDPNHFTEEQANNVKKAVLVNAGHDDRAYNFADNTGYAMENTTIRDVFKLFKSIYDAYQIQFKGSIEIGNDSYYMDGYVSNNVMELRYQTKNSIVKYVGADNKPDRETPLSLIKKSYCDMDTACVELPNERVQKIAFNSLVGCGALIGEGPKEYIELAKELASEQTS